MIRERIFKVGLQWLPVESSGEGGKVTTLCWGPRGPLQQSKAWSSPKSSRWVQVEKLKGLCLKPEGKSKGSGGGRRLEFLQRRTGKTSPFFPFLFCLGCVPIGWRPPYPGRIFPPLSVVYKPVLPMKTHPELYNLSGGSHSSQVDVIQFMVTLPFWGFSKNRWPSTMIHGFINRNIGQRVTVDEILRHLITGWSCESSVLIR